MKEFTEQYMNSVCNIIYVWYNINGDAMKKLFITLLFLFLTTNVYAFEITSKNAVLYNLKDDTVVYEVNKDEKISIASMTKIMTVLVAVDNIDNIEKEIVITKEAFKGVVESNASVAGFKTNEKVTYKDLLYGTLLPSGAEASQALAINVAGSVDNFVKLMNEKSEELNLDNTHFANVTGLDHKEHYSTVNSVAILLKHALKNETFKEIFTSKSYTTSSKRLTFYSTLVITLDYNNIDMNYVIGSKTGFTENAGKCLASVAYDSGNDLYYMLVTANSKDKTSYSHVMDAKTIYEYYFNNYGYHNIVDIEDVLISLDTEYRKEEKVEIKSKSNISKYLENTFKKEDLEYKYNGIDTIKYGTMKNTKLGTLDIIYKGTVIESVPIILDRTLNLSIDDFINPDIKIISLCIMFVIIIVLLLVVIKRFRKSIKRNWQLKYKW